ncbi:MAG: hypothetical protein ACR2ID_09540, partial [Chthoniobacterales bacterium]
MKLTLFVAILCVAAASLTTATAQLDDGHYIVSTWAGLPGTYGAADGLGTTARFTSIYGVALDAAGNLYVADTSYHTIRKVNAGGAVTTLAGSAGFAGSADGTGSAARFDAPGAIAVDAAGTVYVADTNNHTIRKITPAGVVSTFAGSPGVIGSTDGTGSNARFYFPSGIAVDAKGYVYVSDSSNHTIRKITPAGLVSTFAGMPGAYGFSDGVGIMARFNLPYGIAATPGGTLYVADTYNHSIRKITPDATVTTVAGGGVAGAADGNPSSPASRFNAPRGIAVDASENLFVADEYNDTIRKVTPARAVSTLAGVAGQTGSTDGGGPVARFNRAAAIAVGPTGTLYIGDTQNFTIRRAVPPPLTAPLLDPSFVPGAFDSGDVQQALLQPDGKLVLMGQFNKIHGIARHHLARLNPDGSLDLSFDPGDGPDYTPGHVLLQDDGKLILVGSFYAVNGVPRRNVARLNTDGSLDVGFDPGQYFDAESSIVYTVVLQENGKLVVAGQFSTIHLPSGDVPRSCVARFNSDGSFDPSFDPGSGFGDAQSNQIILRAVRQTLGRNKDKIVVCGVFDTFNGNAVQYFARLNPDGSFDSSFAGPSIDYDSFGAYNVYGLFAQSDDRIVVYGSFSLIDGAARSGIVRLNSTGSVDSGFNTLYFADYDLYGLPTGVAQQPDGRLLVGGYFHSLGGVPAQNLVRLLPSGARDPSFDSSVAAGPSGSHVTAVCLRPEDGHIFAGGYFNTYDGAPRENMAWVSPDGALDPQFAGLSGAGGYVPQIYAIAPQPDGKILAGGFFSTFNGAPHYNLVRLNADASIDPSFNASFQSAGSV